MNFDPTMATMASRNTGGLDDPALRPAQRLQQLIGQAMLIKQPRAPDFDRSNPVYYSHRLMAPQRPTRKNLNAWALLALALLAVFACRPVAAHELQENRATLVQREANFVSMTLYIDLPEALHRALAPERSFGAFALAQANLPPDAFRAVMRQAVGRMQSEMRVTALAGRPISVERWVWPEPERVQALLRERLMEAVVAPGDHTHTAPLEVRAELYSVMPITSLRVQFAAALGRVMVVSYRPKQVWVESSSPSPVITF